MGTVLWTNRLCCSLRVTVSWHLVPISIGCSIKCSAYLFSWLEFAVFMTWRTPGNEAMPAWGVAERVPPQFERKTLQRSPLSLGNHHLIDKFICD